MINRNPRKDPMVVLWAAAHRNALTEVAKKFDVTPQFCHMVLYARRKSRDGRIERALKEMGAPLKFNESV
jgi:hypothetical protein